MSLNSLNSKGTCKNNRTMVKFGEILLRPMERTVASGPEEEMVLQAVPAINFLGLCPQLRVRMELLLWPSKMDFWYSCV